MDYKLRIGIMLVVALAIVGVSVFLPGILVPAKAPIVQGPPIPTFTRTPLVMRDQPLSITATARATLGTLQSSGDVRCTYTVKYWEIHTELLPQQAVIGGVIYTREMAVAILQLNTDDVFTNLIKQLYAAYLNGQVGAPQDLIQGTMLEAGKWLSSHPVSSTLIDSDRQRAVELTRTLRNYNEGQIGPGLCNIAGNALEPTSSVTDTVVPTPTPTFVTPSPTITASPTTISRLPLAPLATNTLPPYIPPQLFTATPTERPVSQPPTRTPTQTSSPIIPTETPTDHPTPTLRKTDIPTPTLAP